MTTPPADRIDEAAREAASLIVREMLYNAREPMYPAEDRVTVRITALVRREVEAAVAKERERAVALVKERADYFFARVDKDVEREPDEGALTIAQRAWRQKRVAVGCALLGMVEILRARSKEGGVRRAAKIDTNQQAMKRNAARLNRSR